MNSDENLKNKPSLFIKGGVGGPGRPKNAINKNRLVSEVLNKLNFDPLTEAVSLFRDESRLSGKDDASSLPRSKTDTGGEPHNGNQRESNCGSNDAD